MDRQVQRSYIDNWIDKNGPDGLLVLAQKSGVSASTISKARIGIVPKKQRTRDQICRALGISEKRVFPLCEAEEDAS